MDGGSEINNLPVRVYRKIGNSPGASEELLAKFRIHLPDRPGSLAAFASVIADRGGNISFFHYDRSKDSNRVVVEVRFEQDDSLQSLLNSLKENHYSFDSSQFFQDDLQITALENILEIKVRLGNIPGTLAAFASALAEHDANVIFMLYDEDIDPGSADISMVTKDPEEIDRLLNAINEKGYYYRVVYRGTDEQEVSHIIGLKLVEKFFIRLKKLLPQSDIEELKSLVESSKDLSQDLLQFYKEAGNNLEAGDVFEKVLTFASRSRSRTGDKFSVIEMPVLKFGDVTLSGFRLPTSENLYVFRHGDELTMIDSGHGIYYEDIKRLLKNKSLDPAKVKRIFVTHPDTDHAGASGYFEDEFGARIFMHPGSDDVISNMNRAHGISGGLLDLNKYYTRLSVKFTACKFPMRVHHLATDKLGRIGGFKIIDTFEIGDLRFDVLESHGGHTAGLVFYLNREYGLIFTSDFLLNIQSLSPEEKEHMSIYRYLLTNPNSNSNIYKEETAALKQLIESLNRELKRFSRAVCIFPGHGEYYRFRDLI
ncbi:MAG: MBL fold metallo-hydrolase [Nitrospirae bacterium]|nr:MBL fold metallo-hydrolase [Nitrospirota bacterium]